MNKLLQHFGLATSLPLLLSIPILLGTQALSAASLEPAKLALAESQDPADAAKGCRLSPAMAKVAEEITEQTEEVPLAVRFGPAPLAELRAASCAETLDVVNRELLLAALARIEQVEDGETQLTMLMEIAELYQALELPQTLPLLDYLFVQSQALDQPGNRLRFAVATARRYRGFRTDEKTPFPREQAAMEAAVVQITQLDFNTGSSDVNSGDIDAGDRPSSQPEQAADVYAVALWYSQQDDLAKARQIVSHIDERQALNMFKQQLEEAYAHALEQAGEIAKADRHRRENLPPESLAIYAEAKAHERMATLAESLPKVGEAIGPEQLKTLQRNVHRLTVPWAKYTYGQMVARQLILQDQYEAALDILAQAPAPEVEDGGYYIEQAEAAPAGDVAGEAVDFASLEIDLGFESARLLPVILATEVAADGYVDEAIAFIEHLPETDSTRLLQRAMLLSGVAVFHSNGADIGPDQDSDETALGESYLTEAIALAETLPEQPINASLWFLISLAQRWRSDDASAEASMEQAIAIAPALASVNEEILVELEKEPWILDEELIAASEQYGSIRKFYEALQEKDLAAAEMALAETEDLQTVVSLQGTLAAAYSKEDQPEKAKQLLSELWEMQTAEELLENFGGDEAQLQQHLLSSFTSSNGYITVLQATLETFAVLELEQREDLLRHALEVYSYSQGYEDIPVAELMARRDAVMALESADSPMRKQMLRSLATSLATHGHWHEAIAFLPEFDLRDQVYGLVALSSLYNQQSERPAAVMRLQLQSEIQDLALPAEESDN